MIPPNANPYFIGYPEGMTPAGRSAENSADRNTGTPGVLRQVSSLVRKCLLARVFVSPTAVTTFFLTTPAISLAADAQTSAEVKKFNLSSMVIDAANGADRNEKIKNAGYAALARMLHKGQDDVRKNFHFTFKKGADGSFDFTVVSGPEPSASPLASAARPEEFKITDGMKFNLGSPVVEENGKPSSNKAVSEGYRSLSRRTGGKISVSELKKLWTLEVKIEKDSSATITVKTSREAIIARQLEQAGGTAAATTLLSGVQPPTSPASPENLRGEQRNAAGVPAPTVPATATAPAAAVLGERPPMQFGELVLDAMALAEKIEPVDMTGTLDEKVTDKVIRSRLPLIITCYNAEAKEVSGGLQGKVTAFFVIETDGTTSDVKVTPTGGMQKGPKTTQCIKDIIEKTRFPKPDQKTPVKYPFVLIPVPAK